jgi:hypothetical protein
MKRILAAFVLALCTVVPSWAIVDIGDPAVTRLWSAGDDFMCSATYIREARPGVAWIMTAGHCTGASYARRTVNDYILGAIDWRVAIQTHSYAGKVYDIALGTVPDVRDKQTYHAFFADKMPDAGRVYIHGFPQGVESVVVGTIEGRSKDMRASWDVVVPHAGDILPGSSGSVVLDQQGDICGVLWGLRADPKTGAPTTRVVVTDISVFHEMVKLFDLKMDGTDDAESIHGK